MTFGGASYGDAELGSTTTTTQEIAVPETSLTQSNANPQLEPGESQLQITPPTILTQTTPNLNVNPASATISVQETRLTQTTPEFEIDVGLFIRPPASQLNQSTPSPEIQPGDSTVTVPETELAVTNPEIGLNRKIVVGVVTELNASNPEPSLEPGIVQVNIPETSLTQSTVNPQVEPGEVTIQVTPPTNLTVFTPEIEIEPGKTDLQIEETQLIQTTPSPLIGLEFQFVSPTNALITNNYRYFDMADHTFTQNDFGDILTATLKDEDNPDGVSIQGNTGVTLVIKDKSENKVQESEMNVVDAENGDVEYEWEDGDVIQSSGVYRAKIKVFDASDEPESFPNDGFRTIEVEEEIS